jgi:hypothetical protein
MPRYIYISEEYYGSEGVAEEAFTHVNGGVPDSRCVKDTNGGYLFYLITNLFC